MRRNPSHLVSSQNIRGVSDVLDDIPLSQWNATPFAADAILATHGRS